MRDVILQVLQYEFQAAQLPCDPQQGNDTTKRPPCKSWVRARRGRKFSWACLCRVSTQRLDLARTKRQSSLQSPRQPSPKCHHPGPAQFTWYDLSSTFFHIGMIRPVRKGKVWWKEHHLQSLRAMGLNYALSTRLGGRTRMQCSSPSLVLFTWPCYSQRAALCRPTQYTSSSIIRNSFDHHFAAT